jgi:hypothetical protein
MSSGEKSASEEEELAQYSKFKQLMSGEKIHSPGSYKVLHHEFVNRLCRVGHVNFSLPIFEIRLNDYIE